MGRRTEHYTRESNDSPPQVVVHERDTGVTHNVSVLGELTSLTLPNVTSSRVSVTLTAATLKGFGPSSPPARLDLLMAHYKVILMLRVISPGLVCFFYGWVLNSRISFAFLWMGVIF